MCSLQTKTSFEQRDQLLEVALLLILPDEILQFFSVDDEIQPTDLGKAEFFLLHASLVDLFPYFDAVCSSSTFHCGLIVLKVDQGRSKLGPVGDTCEEYLGSLVQAFLVSLITRGLDI